MAQKVQILLVDDLDGGEANETVTFGLDGKTYEIDLSDPHASELRKLLAPYVEAGRKQGGRSSAGTRGRGPVARPRPAGEPSAEELRKWAKENGYEVNDRGRVPASVKEAWAAANA